MPKIVSFSLSFFTVALAVYILWAASAFFVPLAIALIISYFIITIAEGAMKIPLIGNKLPRSVTYLISFLTFTCILYFMFALVQANVVTLLDSINLYQERLETLIEKVFALLKLDPPDLLQKLDQFDFRSLIQGIILTLTDVASNAGIIFIYIIFILIEYRYYESKMHALFNGEESRTKAYQMRHQIASQVMSYLRIKTLFSLLTALCSYSVLLAVGVDFADFWAFLIFFMNFIPTVGSIIATIFPCLLTILQFENLAPFLIVVISLTSIQFLIGNVLEPRIMGNKFNLSGLVIILSLAIWGKIWGIIGMFLSVPLMIITSIVLANFPQTRPIAIILSQDGDIE